MLNRAVIEGVPFQKKYSFIVQSIAREDGRGFQIHEIRCYI